MTPNRLTKPESLATNLASRTSLARMFLAAVFLAMSAILAGITGNASAQTLDSRGAHVLWSATPDRAATTRGAPATRTGTRDTP